MTYDIYEWEQKLVCFSAYWNNLSVMISIFTKITKLVKDLWVTTSYYRFIVFSKRVVVSTDK